MFILYCGACQHAAFPQPPDLFSQLSRITEPVPDHTNLLRPAPMILFTASCASADAGSKAYSETTKPLVFKRRPRNRHQASGFQRLSAQCQPLAEAQQLNFFPCWLLMKLKRLQYCLLPGNRVGSNRQNHALSSQVICVSCS